MHLFAVDITRAVDALRNYTLALREDISFNFPRMLPSVKYALVAAPIGIAGFFAFAEVAPHGLQRRLYGKFVIMALANCLLSSTLGACALAWRLLL